MKYNILNAKSENIPISKKRFNFCTLQSDQSRIKFRLINDEILVKFNNNLSIRIKKNDAVYIFLKDNRLRLISRDLKTLNQLIQQLSKFSRLISFI